LQNLARLLQLGPPASGRRWVANEMRRIGCISDKIECILMAADSDIFINLRYHFLLILMDVVEAVYEDGVLRVLNPSKIDSDLITVKILNIEDILSEEEEDMLQEALNDREKEKYHTLDEVFG
jgi:predicted DNA-binding antitoxin AbrB/MazE fold protein